MITSPIAIFLTVLIMILFGSVLFRRFRIPSVVGMIICGIIVGPYGLGILVRDESFQIFGEVGILYLMFQAAVEIDMFHLKSQWKGGVLFGLLTFAVPGVAGVLGTHYLLGQGWGTSLLIASMFASHTLITYPVITKFGLQNSRPAVVTVTGTIIAVLLALILLAGIVQYRESGTLQSLVWLPGKLALFMVAVGYAYPWVTRRFFDSTNDTVVQYIFVLALVFIAGLCARFIGLEAILGAFYAGLILNRMIPGRSPLMKNIRFVGDAIFIPYFLIGVGMLINVRVVVKGWDVILIAAVLSSLALGSKWLAAYITQRTLQMRRCSRLVIFGLSGGKAAATIAAVMIGYRYGLLDESMMNAAVVMILICCVVASIVTDRGAMQLRIIKTAAELERDRLGVVEYARQVVCVVNPVTAEGLMRLAVFMRKRLNTNPITTLFVRSNDDAALQATGREAMRQAEAAAEEMDIKVEHVERFDLNIVAGITNVAHEKNSTEIMIGMHRKSSVVDTFYGSMIEKLMKGCTRMVMVSRCFMPVETITRIVTVVPPNAEYETGFHLWVTRMATLAANIEARITFMAYAETCRLIKAAIAEDHIEVDAGYETINAWDDFILLSGTVEDADLLTLISARKGSISYGSDLEQMTAYISRHFRRHNLLIIYPKQW